MNKPNNSQTTRGWDSYWQGARDAQAFTAGGVSHPAVASFWDTILSERASTEEIIRVLDIATGSGAVVERLTQHSGASRYAITCVDISAAAVDSVCTRFPDVVGVVADAKSMPLTSGAYDLVTSQFGIEYAGLAAINEAARLVAPDGSLILLMHFQLGGIFVECATALDAIRRTQQSAFIQHALRFFETGLAAVRGADRAPYDQAALQLNPAIQVLESILSEHGEHVAGDTIAKLYSDVQNIHSRLQYYEPEDVLGWLRTMERELGEYEERMASMLDAAIDDKTFHDVCENLRGQGFTIAKAEPLLIGNNKAPLAWMLSANRQA